MVYKSPLMFVLTSDDLDRPLTNLVNEASLSLTVKPANELMSLLDAAGFTRRGKMTWALPVRDNGRVISRFLRKYAEEFLPGTMHSIEFTENIKDLSATNAITNPYERYNSGTALQLAFSGRTLFRQALNELEDFVFPRINLDKEYQEDSDRYRTHRYNNSSTKVREDIIRKYITLGGAAVEIKNDLFWFRLFPIEDLVRNWEGKIYFPKTKNVKRSIISYHSPKKLIQIVQELQQKYGEGSFDEESIPAFELLDKTREVVAVGYTPNKPATVSLYRGDKVTGFSNTLGLKKFSPGKEVEVPIKEVIALKEKHKNIEFLMHPGLTDLVKMTEAKPYQGEDRLFHYQKEAVGLHLSTELGYLQTCSTGMGKTVMQLAAMRERAKTIPNYRSMVVCEANVRQQWQEDAAVWFPEATVIAVETRDDIDKISEALAEVKPVILISSYSHTLLAYDTKEQRDLYKQHLASLTYKQRMKELLAAPIPDLTIGALMLDTFWHDICADEAVVLRNDSSKQAKILWHIRKNAGVATALTATPINKGPDDMARLVSWVRNDRNMFTGIPLSEQFDTTTVKGAKALLELFGPLVFRRDNSEIADKMPKVSSTTIFLDPSPAEKSLINAAERELKRCYLELVAAVEDVEKIADNDMDAEEVKRIKQNLREANGAWLGGTTLARMASSDPAALADSSSVGAALLIAQGLVQTAMLSEPAKRIAIMKEARKRIDKGQQMLIFTSFQTVAERLTKAFRENGINAKSYTGKNGSTRDQARKEFQAGELDVLVCTKAGNRGLTLHKASAIYHYDIPWTLEEIIQRTGRSVRIGSENEIVEIVFMVMKDTIEQRMAEHVIELGVAASLVLDHSRGIEVKNTETAKAMGGLISTASKITDKKSLIEYGKLLVA